MEFRSRRSRRGHRAAQPGPLDARRVLHRSRGVRSRARAHPAATLVLHVPRGDGAERRRLPLVRDGRRPDLPDARRRRRAARVRQLLPPPRLRCWSTARAARSASICPYHAWSYMLDGTLWGCPDMKDAEGFDRVENGLVPVRMEDLERLRLLHLQPRRADPARGARRPARAHGVAPARRHALHVEDDARAELQLEADPRERDGDVPHGDRPQGHGRQAVVADARHAWRLALHPGHLGPLDRDAARRGAVVSRRSTASTTTRRQGTYFTVLHPACQLVMAQELPVVAQRHAVAHDRVAARGRRVLPGPRAGRPGLRVEGAAVLRAVGGRRPRGRRHPRAPARALGSVLYRPGPLSWRDDEVQAIGIWVLDHLPIEA